MHYTRMFIVLLVALGASPPLLNAQTAGEIIGATIGMYGTGEDYLRICEASIRGDYSSASLQCIAYTTGIADGIEIYRHESKVSLFSIPENVTTGQIGKIVVKYMNDHPKYLHLPTAQLVIWAVWDAYPVQK